MSYEPYPAYKDSGVPWLGLVPEGWRIVRSDAVVRSLKNTIEKSAFEDELVYHYSIPVVQETGEGQIEEGASIQSSKLLIDRTKLLVSKLNPRKATICLARPWEDLVTVASSEFVPLEVSRSLNEQFAFYFWNSESVRQDLDSRVQSVTRSHQRVDPKDISKIILALPPIEEQAAIARFLDEKAADIDKLIGKKEELLRLLAEQRTALITHAVTKGLNPDAPMKTSGVVWFDQVPAHWQVRRLKDVGTLTGGAGFPHEFQNAQGEELFFYKVGDLAKSEDGIHLTSAPHTIDRETAAKLRAAVIPPDAILYAKIGAALLLNRRRISTANCCIDNNMTAWIVDPSKVLPLWGFFWMSTLDFGEHTNPGAVPSLSEGYQSILPIALPPLEEQQAIVDQLVIETNAIDLTVKKTGEAIERLREYRTAIITNAVTGKIKVA